MKTLFFLALLICSLSVFSQDTIVITKTTDPDMFLYPYDNNDSLCAPEMYGTLQWAFRKVEDSGAGIVYIVFNIPGIGPHVISLNYALPQLYRKVIINGASQLGYQPGMPSVIIDGNGNINMGISLYSTDSCIINGLCLRNFRYNGILCNRVNNSQFTGNVIYNITRMLYDLLLGEGAIGFLNSSNNTVKGNNIGTDITGNTYNNRYAGINIQKIPSDRVATPPSYENVIGGTLPGEGNIIANNNGFGVLIGTYCNSNRISGNSIYNNGRGIFLSLGANKNIQPPVITSYQNDTLSGTSAPNDIIEIFGSTGNENANEYLTTTVADSTGNWTAQATTTYPNVIATGTDGSNNTSIFSESFLTKPPCSLVLENSIFCAGGPIYLLPIDAGAHCDDLAWYYIERSWLSIGFCFQFGNDVHIHAPTTVGTYDICLYYVGSTNNNNCAGYPQGNPINCIQFTVLPAPAISPIVASDTHVCWGEPVTLSVTSTNISYIIWTYPGLEQHFNGISYTFTPHISGYYCATGYNAVCHTYTGNECVYITVDGPPTLTINSINPACPNSYNGSVSITGSGGGGSPYTYQWPGMPSNTTGFFNNLSAGNYTVTVTGNNVCTATSVIEIPSISPTHFPVYKYNPSCSCDGYIDIDAPGCAFIWSHDASLNSSFAQNLCPGTYTVTITEPNGCISTPSFTITSPIPYLNEGQPIVLSSTPTTLNQSGNVFGDIIVPDNYTLNIQYCTLKFQPGKRIILGNGSVLRLDNAYLTSIDECNEMWRGISTINSSTPLSSVYVFANESKIENAIIGMNFYNVAHLLLNITGGYPDNTTFINNYYDIKIVKSILYNCLIDNAIFTTNNTLLAPFTYPTFHIYLRYNLNTLNITNSTFENTTVYDPNISVGIRGYGILAHKSNVSVSSFCWFINLYYGIRSRGILTVTQSGFINNHRGILVETTLSNATIKGNTFNIGNMGNTYTPSTYTYGVQLGDCNVFRVENNSFTNGFIGLTTFNTTTGTKIYKNEFHDLFAGFVANGQNNLVLNCNHFFNNGNNAGYYYNDGTLVPPKGGDMVISNGKINTTQSWVGIASKSTWNSVFNPYCGTLSNVFKFRNTTSTSYTYKYCTNGDQSDISNCKSTNVTASPDGSLYNTSNYNSNCITIPLLFNKSVNTTTGIADSLYNTKNNLQNLLINLVDDGNTEQFLGAIAILAPNNFIQFYNQLMASSPYLSDTVLIAFMTHPINKPTHKKNVVLANSPLPVHIRPYIAQMNVNQNFKNQMWAAQTNSNNARVELENQILSLDMQRQTEINDLVLDCIYDSLGFKTDSVINYLSNTNVFADHEFAFNLLTNKERYSEAGAQITAMDFLKSEFSLSKQEEISDYLFVNDIFLNTLQQPDSIANSLITANSSLLLPIANAEFHFAQDDARALLEQIGYVFPRNVYLDETINNKSLLYKPEKEVGKSLINIFPNPATESLQIEFNGNSIDIIEIKDITSKIIKVIQVKDSSTGLEVSLLDYANGIYFISFKNNGLTIENQRFVISKY